MRPPGLLVSHDLVHQLLLWRDLDHRRLLWPLVLGKRLDQRVHLHVVGLECWELFQYLCFPGLFFVGMHLPRDLPPNQSPVDVALRTEELLEVLGSGVWLESLQDALQLVVLDVDLVQISEVNLLLEVRVVLVHHGSHVSHSLVAFVDDVLLVFLQLLDDLSPCCLLLSLQRLLFLLGLSSTDGERLELLSQLDVLAVVEPNVLVLVFEELGLHLQDLKTAGLLNVVAEPETLLLNERLVIARGNQLKVTWIAPEVVDYVCLGIHLVYRGKELSPEELTQRQVRNALHHSLDHFDSLKILLRASSILDPGRGARTAEHDHILRRSGLVKRLLSILSGVLAQPVQAFVESLILQGTHLLHVPRGVLQRVQIQLVDDLRRLHRLHLLRSPLVEDARSIFRWFFHRGILFVRQDENSSALEFVEQTMQMPLDFRYDLPISGIDHKDEGIS